MVRDKNLWTNEFRGLHTLADSHREWLVDREESKIDSPEPGHFFNRLGIPGDIYPEAIEIKDISIAISLRMEHFPAF